MSGKTSRLCFISNYLVHNVLLGNKFVDIHDLYDFLHCSVILNGFPRDGS